ncbi:MAG: peptidase M48 [Gammaproteobacteria bacterium]|nr:peptidase M48 [Gammaproteobacteria bacterium]
MTRFNNPLALILLATVFLVGLGTPTPGRQVMAMSEAEELEVGKAAHQQILQQYRIYNNQNLQKYVQFIGQKLAEKSARPHLNYSFLILDSEEVNAFALPGGYIYITRGLMAYLKSEAELAAVIGHEIGHVAARHAAKQESASEMANVGTALAAILGALYVPGLDPGVSSDLLGVGSNALLKGYGRDHELEADTLGAEYLIKSGYDTRALLDVITTLKNQETYEFKLARMEGRTPRIYHGLFATHPSSDKRLQEAVATGGKFVSDEPVYAGNDTYLNLINGLNFGTDVRQGIVINSNYYHGPLGYAIRFPDGWSVDNKTNAVMARNKTDSALIQITYMSADRRLSPKDYMQKRLGLNDLREQQELTIYGLPAHTGLVAVNSPYGRRLSRVTVIYYGNRAIILSSATKDSGGINRYDPMFLETARSFRPMSRPERMAAGQLRIRLIRADENTTYQSLAANSPLHNLAEEQLRLLNGDYPTGEIKAGAMVKIVQ